MSPLRPLVAFVVLIPAAVLADESDRSRLERMAGRVDALERAVARARTGLDPARFDARALAAKVDGPEEAFTHVRDAIGLEFYRGSLRGAGGTLASGSGNPLDRALLLAALLGHVGWETRIVSASLSQEELEQVSRACRVGPARPRANASFAEAAAPFQDLMVGMDAASLERRRAEFEKGRADLVGRVLRHARTLADRLEAAKTTVAPGAGRIDLSAQGRTHYWVQARKGGGGAWIDHDPTLPLAAPGERMAAGKESAVPPAKLESLAVQFRMAIAVDILRDGRLEEVPLLEVSLPVSHVWAGRIVLSIVPGGDLGEAMDGTEEGRWRAAFDRVDTFQPILLLGDETLAGRPFDVGGNVYEVSRSGDLEDLAGTAGGLLGGFGGGGRAPARAEGLVALRLVLTIPGPDGKMREHRRMLADRSAELAVDDKDRRTLPPREGDALRHWKMSLSRTVGAMVLVGRIEEDAYVDRLLAAEAVRLGVLRQALAIGRGKEPGRKAAELLDPLDPYPGELLAFAIARQELLDEVLARRGGTERLAYAAPNVILHHVAFHGDVDGKIVVRRGLDIVENGLRVEGDDPGNGSPPALLVAGVADTVLEGALVAAGAPCAEILNTARLFEALDPVDLRVLSGRGVDLSDVPLGPAARERVAAELAAGRVVVVSARPLAAGDRPADAWWSIDPTTGTTVGRGSGGEGQGMVEYAQKIWTIIKIRGALIPGLLCGLALGAVKNGVIHEGLLYCILSFGLPLTFMREASYNAGALVVFLLAYTWSEWVTSD